MESVSLDNRDVGAEFKCAYKVWRLLFHEAYNASLHSVDREVRAELYVLSRMDFGTALANNNFARFNGSTISALNAEIFGLRIAAVSC